MYCQLNIYTYIYNKKQTNKKTEIMRKLKLETAKKMIKDGKFECESDLKIGYVSVRYSTGKRTYIEIV